MLSTARTRGPFAPQMAGALRRLGWFIIAGVAAVSAVHGLALDLVINTWSGRLSAMDEEIRATV